MKTVHLNLSQLELLVALVEAGSFSGAAVSLGLTQSAASHALARLESELGALLVERGKRKITLTAAGERVLQHARGALSHVAAIRGVAVGGIMGGRLRVGLAPPLPARLVAEVASAFGRAHPDVELQIGDLMAGVLEEWLETGRLDVGLVCRSPGAATSDKRGGKDAPALEVRPLLRDEMRAVVSRDHAWSALERVPRDELVGASLLLPHADRGLVALLRGQGGRGGLRHPFSDAATMLAGARAGLGAALLPRLMLDLPSDGLVALPIEPAIEWNLGLAARSWELPATRAFAEVAQSWTKQHAPELRVALDGADD